MGGTGGGGTVGGAVAEEDPEMVRLITSDDFEFVVDRRAACVSSTIRNMLTGPGAFVEQTSGRIEFPELSSAVMERVVQYFYYKLQYSDSSAEIPDFPIDPESALTLLMAASFLDT